jgi:hypothetical protein
MSAAGCSGQPSNLPTPKSPVSVEQFLPQLPPARPKVPWPLPVVDAERILNETGLFNRNAWRQIQAYNVLMDQPDRLVRFQAIARNARRAGQVYALCALWALDVLWNRSVGELVRLVEDERIWVELRSLRDEAYLRYKKTG